MKNLLILFFALVFSWGFSQTYDIKYTMTFDTEKIKDSINKNEQLKKFISEDMMKDIVKTMGETRVFLLSYSEGVSLYKQWEDPNKKKKEEDDEEDDMQVGQKRTFNFARMMRNFQPVIYKNHNEGYLVEQKGIMDKQFLVRSELAPNFEWEITDKTRKYGDQTCRVAISKNPITKWPITACFNEEIPIPEGPGDYHGLPGLVVEVKEGAMTITMNEVSILKDKKKIEEPKEGTKTTKEEFTKMMQERAQQMGGPGRGNRMMFFR